MPSSTFNADRRMVRVLRRLLLLIAISSIIWMAISSELPVSRLLSLNWVAVALLLAAHACCNILLAESLRLNLGKHNLKFAEAHRLTYIRTYANLALPFGGTGYAAYLLKQEQQISMTRLGAASFEWTAHQFFAVALLGFIALARIRLPEETVTLAASITLGSVMSASLLSMLASRVLPLKWTGRFREPLQQWRDEQLGVHTLLQSITLQLALTMVRVARLASALLALGYWPGIWETMLYSIAGDLVSLVNLTPSGIGLREALVALTARLVTTAAGIVLLAALLERIAISLLTIGVGSAFLNRSLRNARGEP